MAIPEKTLLRHTGVDFPALKMLFDPLEIAAAVVSNGIILYANTGFAEMLGKHPWMQVEGQNLNTLFSSADWQALAEGLRRGVSEKVSGTMKVYGTNRESKEIRVTFNPISYANKACVLMVGIEVAEKIPKTSKGSEKSTRSLSARLLKIQDEERRRIARDLHDTTGQELAAAIISIDAIARAANDDTVKKLAFESADLIRKAEAEIRTLSYVLHPPLLDDLGLRSAIYAYTEGFAKRTGIQVDVDIPSDLPRFGIENETSFFRVIQESLANVYRHSGSPTASVRIVTKGSCIKGLVNDQGKGFDARKVAQGGATGVGLRSMKERLAAIGGGVRFKSGHSGTKVIASLPFQTQKELSGEKAAQLGPQSYRAIHPGSGKQRILIVDDQEITRHGIRRLLQDKPHLEICGEAADGRELVPLIEEFTPDLIILDLAMPHVGGFAGLHQIRKSGLSVKILIYTTHTLGITEKMARTIGCEGFVAKSRATNDLIEAIETILQGGTFFRLESADAPDLSPIKS